MGANETRAILDEVDRAIILQTQAGLPLVLRPYHEIASRVGIAPGELMQRMRRMRALRVIRRIAAVPNHYAIGMRANGMSVWDVDDALVGELGPRVGALSFVSHCYRRPRRPPLWRYNLFAMVHGATRAEVEAHVAAISAVLGSAARAREVLYSTRILKKTGLRLHAEPQRA